MASNRKSLTGLRGRLLVSFIGIPGLLALIWLGDWPYALLITVVVMLGLYEYLRALASKNLHKRHLAIYLAGLALLAVTADHVGLLNIRGLPQYETSILITFFVLLFTLQIIEVLKSSPKSWLNLSSQLLGVAWIAGFGCTFILLREWGGPILDMSSIDWGYRLTLALFVAVWICDSLAYMIGKKYGKLKILPSVSPKKTVVGTLSGVGGGLATMLVVGITGWIPGSVLDLYQLAILGLIVGVLGQTGDFVESRFKRDFGIKDSGTLLPGHGGVLDRFDSLLYVMPVSFLYIQWIY